MSYKKNEELSTKKVYFKLRKSKDKDNKNFSFELVEKVGEKYETTGNFNLIAGYLLDVRTKTWVYEGEEQVSVVFELLDEEDLSTVINVESNLNSLSRNILNYLAGQKDFSKVLGMKIYMNKNGWPAVYLTLDGEAGNKWKYDSEEIPKVEEVKLKSKTVKDYTDMNNFFVEMIGKDIIPVLSSTKIKVKNNHQEPEFTVPDEDTPTSKSATTFAPKAQEADDMYVDSDDDDLPF